MSKKHVTKVEFQGKDKTAGATRSFTGNLENANAAVTKALGKYGALAGAAAGVAAGIYKAGKSAYEFIDRMASLGDEMDKLSARTGLAVEELGKYDYIVKLGGGSTGDMEAFVKRLSRSMSDARDGIKESTDAFARLGISTDQLVNGDGSLKDISQILPLLSDGFKRVSSQADRMDLAQAIGGRGGTMLLPALQGGREELERLENRLRSVGGVMSSDFSTASAKFKDAQLDVSNSWQRLREDFSQPFVMANTVLLEALAKTLGSVRQAAVGARASLSALGFAGGGFGLGGGVQADQGSLYGDYLASGGRGDGWSVGQEALLAGPRGPAMAGENGYSAAGDALPFLSIPAPTQDMVANWEAVNENVNEFADRVVNVEARWTNMELMVAASFADNMSAAFDRVLWYGQDVADALGQMFKDTFSSILSGLFRVGVGAGLNYISPGLGTALGFPTLGKRASGGPVTGGRPYIVGENGPELYVPQGSGSIVPNHAMGGSRTFNVNITAQDMSDPMHLRRLAKKLIQAIQDEEGYYYAGASA